LGWDFDCDWRKGLSDGCSIAFQNKVIISARAKCPKTKNVQKKNFGKH
jgi:hypothetical protein